MINDIRIAPNELYGHKVEFHNPQDNEENTASSELISENQPKQEENANKINLSSLGAPAGFFADISMLDEADANELGIIQFENTNPYLM